jgi:hypothetical protein
MSIPSERIQTDQADYCVGQNTTFTKRRRVQADNSTGFSYLSNYTNFATLFILKDYVSESDSVDTRVTNVI